MVLLLVLSAVGCTKSNQYRNLNKDDPDLSYSMEAFFSLGMEPVVSESFQAVFSDLTEVKYHDAETYGWYTHIMYMRYFLSPVTSRPLSLKSVTVSPTGEAYGYLNRDLNNGRSSLKDWQGFTDKLVIPKWSAISDFTAYRLLITYSDLGNDTMASYGIDTDMLDQGMENVILRIRYDGGEDEINLSFGKKPHVVDSKADPLLLEKPYLKPVLSDGIPEFRLEPLR